MMAMVWPLPSARAHEFNSTQQNNEIKFKCETIRSNVYDKFGILAQIFREYGEHIRAQ